MVFLIKMNFYQPREDSYLMSTAVKQHLKNKSKDLKILDMGSGSGIQAQTCKNLGFNNILTADINQGAVKHLRKIGFESIKSDLFSHIKKQKFDLIIFNPPYLPEDKHDREKDTTGGKRGYETILRFLKQAKDYLSNNGSILLLFSSLSQPQLIIDESKRLGYNIKLLNSQKLFFEEIFVYELF